jgi:hypothetical protein
MFQTAELGWLRRDFFALPGRGELAGECFLKERLFEFVDSHFVSIGVGNRSRVDGCRTPVPLDCFASLSTTNGAAAEPEPNLGFTMQSPQILPVRSKIAWPAFHL